MKLTTQTRNRIHAQLESGRFEDEDEIVNLALDLLESAEGEILSALSGIDEGRAQLDRGEGTSASIVIAELRDRHRRNLERQRR